MNKGGLIITLSKYIFEKCFKLFLLKFDKNKFIFFLYCSVTKTASILMQVLPFCKGLIALFSQIFRFLGYILYLYNTFVHILAFFGFSGSLSSKIVNILFILLGYDCSDIIKESERFA